MKYVVYLENPDSYFERMICCFNTEDEAKKVVSDYCDMYSKLTDEGSGLYAYTIENYFKNNTTDRSHTEVCQEYWDNFGGVGIEKWLIDNCDETLYSLFKELGLDLLNKLHDQYSIYLESVLEK